MSKRKAGLGPVRLILGGYDSSVTEQVHEHFRKVHVSGKDIFSIGLQIEAVRVRRGQVICTKYDSGQEEICLVVWKTLAKMSPNPLFKTRVKKAIKKLKKIKTKAKRK